MSKYEVESGVPAPDRRGRDKYPWQEMKPGDSFVVPIASFASAAAAQRAVLGAGRGWTSRNRRDLRCITKMEGDVVRVWLVKRDGDES